MTRKFRQNIGTVLEETEEEIVAGFRDCEEELKDLSNNEYTELGDRAANSKSVDELDSVMRYYERRLARTRSAKKRLENGNYGICMECGKTISEPRLSANPAALFCIECASRRERLRKYRRHAS